MQGASNAAFAIFLRCAEIHIASYDLCYQWFRTVRETAEQTLHIVGIAYVISAIDNEMLLPKLAAVVLQILFPFIELHVKQERVCGVWIFF